MTPSLFPKDFVDLFVVLSKHSVKYLIVGAEAVIYHGFARLTGDIDIFYESSRENCRALFNALQEFWSGPVPGIGSPEDLSEQGMIFQFGYPPNRIDLINSISGVDFLQAWEDRISETLFVDQAHIPIHYIGLAALITNKEAAGRPKDLEDLRYLKEAAKKTTVDS